jgi:peptidoglycan/LPS O-acetylase OafA/YrhL
MRHGLVRFMRAHGQTPGPGQRPRTAGAAAGLLAGMAAVPLLQGSGALESVSDAVRLSTGLILVLYLAIAAIAGAFYGGIFQRAASDRRGGWLFGISYGFLLWMLGPVTLLQAVLERPLATGTAAMGVLGANLISGLVLGLLFRPIHKLLQKRLRERTSAWRQATSPVSPAPPIAFPHTLRNSK